MKKNKRWQIRFIAEAGAPDQLPRHNLEQAFSEFFAAKEKQFREQSAGVEAAEASGEPWPAPEPEIGDGKDNAFEASNGIKIWFKTSPGTKPYWGIYHEDRGWMLDNNRRMLYYPAKEIAQAHCEDHDGWFAKKIEVKKTDSVTLPEYDGDIEVRSHAIIFNGPHERGDWFTNGGDVHYIYDGEVWICNQTEPEAYAALAKEFGRQ